MSRKFTIRPIAAIIGAGLAGGWLALTPAHAGWLEQQINMTDGYSEPASGVEGAAGRAESEAPDASLAHTLEQMKLTDGYFPVSKEAESGARGRGGEEGPGLDAFVERQLQISDGSH